MCAPVMCVYVRPRVCLYWFIITVCMCVDEAEEKCGISVIVLVLQS
jgi:hypothetical protein